MLFMNNTKLSPQQRLNKAVSTIMGIDEYAALHGVLLLGTKQVLSYVPPFNTASTDGVNEFYSEAFIELLNDAELRFLILHETYHKMYKHLITWEHLFRKCAAIAGEAADYVINYKLVQDARKGVPITMPSIGLYDERFATLNVQQVFDILWRENGNKPKQPDQGAPGMDHHDHTNAKKMTETEKNSLERLVDQALRQGALTAGKMGSGGARKFDQLLEPVVNWQEEMREFVVTTCAGSDYSTWRRPNRRFVSTGHYLPSGISECVGELLIAPDMSGSTYSIAPLWLAEACKVAEVAKPSALRLCYWDTKVCCDERYLPDQFSLIKTQSKPAGGGGTCILDLCDHVRKLREKPQAVIILTDGDIYGGWGSFDVPVLWCIVNNKRARPPYGKVVHIEV